MPSRDHTDPGVGVGFRLLQASAGIGDKALDRGNFEESLTGLLVPYGQAGRGLEQLDTCV